MKWLALLGAAILVAGSIGCPGRHKGLADGSGGGAAGHGGTATGGTSGTGSGGTGMPGTGGAAGVPAACAGPSDARLVVADQRILRLTTNQVLNTVRYLVDATEVSRLVTDKVIGSVDDPASDNSYERRRFPPLQDNELGGAAFTILDHVAEHVASYVLANVQSLTRCPTVTDACATTYLNALAAKAYRRTLTRDEQTRFTALYDKLRTSQTVNGYQVTFTAEEATSYAVQALLSSPQMLWRWELGDATAALTAPAGIPLTDQELATQVAFFLTDEPPDDMLLAAANGGTLRANLAAYVDARLSGSNTKPWLRTIIATYLQINQLRSVAVDPVKFPATNPTLVTHMDVEAQKFLDNALWNGVLTDLLLSRTTYLNANLATNIYMVPVPAGATDTNWVLTTLPAEQRSGLLTNAAFLTSLPFYAAATGSQDPLSRGEAVAALLLCMPPPGAGQDIGSPDPSSLAPAQERVAARADVALCATCHKQFDPYGLALDNYDSLGRFRTIDEQGRPIDAHATLPAAIGGGTVANAIELAEKLAASPAFTNCMARTLLQYALVDPRSNVEVPLPPQQAGCATADVVQRYQAVNGKTFTDLVRATAAAPAFTLRRAAP